MFKGLQPRYQNKRGREKSGDKGEQGEYMHNILLQGESPTN